MKWKHVEFSELVQDGAFGPRFSSKSYADDGNIATLRTTDLSLDGTISYDTMPLASLDDSKFAKHFLQVGDIVISRSGRIGTTAYFEGHPVPVLPGAFLLYFRFNNLASPRFYTYWFNSPVGQQRILSIARGAAQQNINLTNTLKLRVPVPPKTVQERVVEILLTYDDLIENNRRRIELLEQSARLLYKEWFVHLRFPGHEHVTITNGIPGGWAELDLNSIVTIKHGYAFKGAFFSDDPTSKILLTPGNFKVGGGVQFKKMKYYNEDGPIDEDYVLERDELLVTMTDLSKESDTLGFPLLVPEFHQTTFLHNQRLGAVRPVEGQPFYRYFLFHLFCDYRYRGAVKGSATGTSVKHSSPTRILAYKQVLPPYTDKLISMFDDFAREINAQCQTLLRANESLADARDLLLPRLMNGEISV